MRKSLVLLVAMTLAGAAAAYAEDWKGVSLVDKMCYSKVKDDPDKHETSCLVSCAKSGYGIITADGKYLMLDKAGNEKALAALKATDKKDHVRVNVTGALKGTTVQVTELSLQ
jgi:hypothetical protein